MAMGRPQRPYQPSWPNSEPVAGLYKCPDGRWRINATGQKFTEPDERRAINKFMLWKEQQGIGMVKLPVEVTTQPTALEPQITINNQPATVQGALVVSEAIEAAEQLGIKPMVKVAANYSIPKVILMNWLRIQLTDASLLTALANDVGIPELAGLRHFDLPMASIPVAALLEVYRKNSPATKRSQQGAIASFKRLTDFCNAKNLEDLTQQKLLEFKHHIEADNALKSAGTKRCYYGRIKAMIAFGMKVGLDSQQLSSALDRCKVLWTAEPVPGVDPHPISKADFGKLLETAGQTQWRAMLLLALNMAMTIEDLLELRWTDFDLKAGTYAQYRVKTKRKQVPRIAVLWPETIEQLKALPHKSEYVFTSPTGLRYNRSTKYNDFADLAKKAGLPNVRFSHIRDGAYGIACNQSTDERHARLLAGHKAAGLQDNYVLRNPGLVKEVCGKVYDAYLGQ